MSKEKQYLLSLISGIKPNFSVNWEKLLNISEYSKACALLFSRLKGFGSEIKAPPEIIVRLEDIYKKNLIRNSLVLEEFNVLCKSLAQEDINIILLKGMSLISTVYKDSIAVRRMEDVDILIREKDCAKADQLLRRLGFNVLADNSKSRKAAMYFKYNVDGSVLMPVHLHWHISSIAGPIFELSCKSIDMNKIWENAGSLREDLTGNVFVMSPEHAVLALCEHAGLRHGFSRVMLIYDIHLFITENSRSLDWGVLKNDVLQWRLAVPLRAGLLLCQRLFATAIPRGFLETLQPEGQSILEKYFLNYCLRADFPKEEMCLLLYFAMNRKLSQKSRLLLACLLKI